MVLAARGARDLDGGPETLDDPEAVALLRRQARRVVGWAVLLAAVLTVLSWAVSAR